MANYWMVRSDRDIRDLVEDGDFVAIGFGGDVIGDIGDFSREQIEEEVRKRRPDATPRQISSDASQLFRFLRELRVDDLVITNLGNRQYLVGKIASDYKYDASTRGQPYRRSVKWQSSVHRDDLTPALRASLGSQLTVFTLSRHEAEIQLLLGGQSSPTGIDFAELDPSQVDVKARRHILDHIVSRFPAHEFEGLVRDVLTAMGLEVEGHGPGPDKGVDLIARHGLFNFEQIVVQVKNHAGAVGSSDVRNLRGTHESGRKLFVSARGYTSDAQKLADSDVNLELLSGQQLVNLLIEYYDKLPEEVQKAIPLRKVFLLDFDEEEDN